MRNHPTSILPRRKTLPLGILEPGTTPTASAGRSACPWASAYPQTAPGLAFWDHTSIIHRGALRDNQGTVRHYLFGAPSPVDEEGIPGRGTNA